MLFCLQAEGHSLKRYPQKFPVERHLRAIYLEAVFEIFGRGGGRGQRLDVICIISAVEHTPSADEH